MSSPRRRIVAALAVVVALGTSGAASARPSTEWAVADPFGPSAARRGTSGATDVELISRPFTVPGSPYEWTIEASQSRSGPGVPPNDPNLRIFAERTSSTGNRPYQVHAWEFDLAAGSLSFTSELRHVGLDTGLIPGYGAIFLDLEDLNAIRTSTSRCPSTGDVLTRRSVRKGVLRGSVTFLPGYDDPQMPDELNLTHVRGRITRTRYTSNDCPFPNRCDPGKVLSSIQPTGPGEGYLVNAGTDGRQEGLVFQQFETVGVATVMHLVLAFGDEDVVDATPTTVEVRSDVAAPFVEPGDVMSWTKGTKTVHETSRCRRTGWQLLTPEGSFDLHLDSGDQTIAAPATAEYEVEKRL